MRTEVTFKMLACECKIVVSVMHTVRNMQLQ